MLKRIQRFLLFLLVVGCVEPYEFVIKNNEPALVVEAFISDKSFNETLDYPSDGRYFTVKLTNTSDVTNVRPVPITSAQVQLLTDRGEIWEYTESNETPGSYILLDDEFRAEVGVAYKLNIKLPDENIYESDWQSMPTKSSPPIGQISFRETDIQKYVFMANEEVLVTAKGMWIQLTLPENTTNEPLYYRWTNTPHWIYVAPLAESSPGRTCWAKNIVSLQTYALQSDQTGKYNKDLFFMETVRNERIFVRYSSLIVQHTMSEDYYSFWKEMQDQNQGGAIFDNPPFNLHTNFHSLGNDKKVSGYFGVVQEQAKRWYFDMRELSYPVENTLKKDCTVPFQDPAPECFDCREYSFGITTEVKPQWWED
jgi:hypothetical protein